MISSGIKRGLATSAVSALAVAGLPLLASSASAVSNNSTVTADQVAIAAPSTATASTKNDGQNSTIRLEAVGGANVVSVKFSYTIGGGTANTIDTVSRNDNGAFSTEWAATGLNGATVVITATALDANGAAIGGGTDTQSVTINSTDESVNVNDGSGLGYFIQSYNAGADNDQNVIVSGTAATNGTHPTLSYWVADSDAGTLGNQPGFVGSGTSTSTAGTNDAHGAWTGVLDINGYSYTATNELLVRALATTDDTESYALYKQAITTVTATADRTNVPAGQEAKVTVKVLDQNGLPIAGAEVRSSDGTLVGYTNYKGEAPVTNQGAGTQYYYANTNDSDPYEPELGDKKSDAITVTQYAPVETTLAAVSKDGSAFDLDEFQYAALSPDTSDIVVTVKDQNGNPITNQAGRTVNYTWVVTPFDGVPAGTAASQKETGTAVIDANGQAAIDLPSTVTDKSGTYELTASLAPNAFGEGGIPASKVLTFKAGEAEIAFDNAATDQAPAGGSDVVTGKLALEDGTGLAARAIEVDYAHGTESNPNGAGDAGIVLANGSTGTSRIVPTDANGKFTATIKDPAESPTQPTESGGVVTADTADTTDASGNTDNPNSQAQTHNVNFIKSVAPGEVKISRHAGEPATSKPGAAPVQFDVLVTDGVDTDPNTAGVQGTPLSNQTVTVTTTDGYFTDGTRAPAPAAGGEAGTYKDLGKSVQVTTDANGVATVLIAMGRDAGFDDDGMVTSTLTATIGSLSSTATEGWDSSNPLNGGAVKLEFSPASEQESSQLPKARAGQKVNFDVFTTDQFDNVVGGELVTLTDNTNGADIVADDADTNMPGTQVESNFDRLGDFYATSTRTVDQTVTGTWNAPTTTYTGAGNTTTTGTTPLTDSKTINWYAVDFAASTFTITSDPEGDVPVGTAVTETVKVIDQNGNPVQGLSVQFIRTGPGGAADDKTVSTNANGEAFYSFVGAEAGTAHISAVVSDGSQNKTLTDDVTFTQDKTVIHPGIVARHIPATDSIAGYDKITVSAGAAGDDAVVSLYRVKDGVAKKVKSKVLGADGKAIFKRADLNGDKKNYYFAKVSETATNFKGRTATVSVK